jgi:uncharacterized BrkB/YihY/UPF0761 family membrane protein
MEMEPTSTAATGFAVSKIYYGLSSLFGGFMLSFFWMPDRLKKHTPVAAGAIIGGVSVGAGVIFGGALAVYLGMNPNDANTALAVGGGIGLTAVAIVSWLANFFDRTKDKDIVQVVQEMRIVKNPPAKKAPAKKTPAKKRVAK